MYSLGGPSLENFRVSEKQFQMCQDHQSGKEHFYYPTRMTFCSQCLADKQIDKKDCIGSRQFCQAMMHRFTTLLDNATFMPVEHIQKEKEYGIPWRSAFKKELYAHADQMYKLMIDQNGTFPDDEDPFVFFH